MASADGGGGRPTSFTAILAYYRQRSSDNAALQVRSVHRPIDEKILREELDQRVQQVERELRKAAKLDVQQIRRIGSASTRWEDLPDAGEQDPRLQVFWLAYLHCQDAVVEFESSQLIASSLSLSDASYWLGMGRGGRDVTARTIRSEHAKHMAKRRHRENEQCRAQIAAWCQEHRAEYRTQTLAIEAASRQVPMAKSTVKSWISDFDNGRLKG
jgi:hypothetical protein